MKGMDYNLIVKSARHNSFHAYYGCQSRQLTLIDTDISMKTRIREHAHVSQPVFARYLNTSESTVQKCETGQKKPSGMALRLLRVVQKHGLEVLVY